MKAHLAALVVALGLLVAPRAEAGTYTFAKVQVTVEVPDAWVIDDQGAHVTFQTKDDTLAINLAWAGDDLDKAWDLLVDQVGKVVTGVTVTRTAGVLGGMSGYVSAGKGKLGGTPVDVLLGVVQAPAAAMTVFVIGEQGKYEAHATEMTAVLESFAAVGAAQAPASAPFGDDEGYAMLAPDAQAFAVQLATAITKEDAKAFLKLVSSKGIERFDGERAKKLKPAKVKAGIKKARLVSAFLGLPASGGWSVDVGSVDGGEGKTFAIYRGGMTSVVTYVGVTRQKGKWKVTGQFWVDHGAE